MKKTGKQVLSLLVSIVLLLTMLPQLQLSAEAAGSIASGTCGENVSWVITDTGTLRITGTGPMANYSTYNGAPWYGYYASIQSVDVGSGVTGIGNWAFASCNKLKTVTIADTVKRIGFRAFSGCQKLTDVDIPGSVTDIGAYAFYNCRGLKSIEIPEGVTTIHPGTFDTCTSLTSVTLPDSLREILGQGTYGGEQVKMGAFAFCSKLTSIRIPSGVTTIGYMAFYGCVSLTTVTIPQSVQSIGASAFGHTRCAISLLGSAPDLEDTCFEGSTLDAYYPCNDNTWENTVTSDFNGNVNWNKSHTMGDDAISQAATCTEDATLTGTCLRCGTTATTTLVDTATGHSYTDGICTACDTIKILFSKQEGDLYYQLDAFGTATVSGTGPMNDEVFTEGGGYTTVWNYWEEQVTKVVIEEGVTRIGNMAFYHCRNLTSVSIPDSVTSIGRRAFAECVNLPYVIIPESVTQIEELAFYKCTGLTSVAFLGSAPTIEEDAFPKTNTTVYHPCDNKTWTDDVKQNYDGTITWAGHLYRDYEPYQDATCTDNAVVTGTCGNCGVTAHVPLPGTATGHNLGADGQCMDCGKGLNILIPMKLSSYTSIFDGWSGAKIEIYTDGVLLRSETVDELELDNLVTIPYDPNVTYTFRWKSGSSDYQCVFDIILDGQILLSGSGSSYSDGELIYTLEKPHFHRYEAVITSPTCSANGAVTHTCATCGDCYSVTIDAVGHRFENGVCLGCGKGELPTDGSCGTSVRWYLDASGTLTISGTGPMKDYTIPQEGATPTTPWYGHRSLIKRVVIEAGVTTIGEYAFHGCQNMTDVTIAQSVTTIGKLAFYNCTGLTQMAIPKSVTTIGSAAFRRCSGLKKVTIPQGVTTIGKIAFFDCTGLTEATVPKSVTSMGEYAFGNCTGLMAITFLGNAPAVDSTCFKMVTATVSYPCGNKTWTADMKQSYGGTITWKADHSFGAYIPNEDATCTEDGTTTRACSICGTTETKTLPGTATGHCYENGTCTVCGEGKITILPGDLNGDGERNTADVASLYAHIKRTVLLDSDALPYADVNGDGTVNIADTARLYAHVKGTKRLS